MRCKFMVVLTNMWWM